MDSYIDDSNQPIPGGYSTAGPGASSPGDNVPDERIREDVCDRLMQFGPGDCTTIAVTVLNGVVTLCGTLATDADIRRAEEAVRSVAGVQSIDNQLRTP